MRCEVGHRFSAAPENEDLEFPGIDAGGFREQRDREMVDRTERAADGNAQRGRILFHLVHEFSQVPVR